MEWRGRRTSRNVEDRRTSGGGRVGGTGSRLGIGGTLIILLLGAYFGVDVTPFLQGGQGGSVATAPAGPNRIDDEDEAFVATILAETEQVWTDIFAQSGARYEPARLVLYRGGTGSACGSAQAAMGPFYCPGDQSVYLDTDFFQVLEQRLGGGGEFAQAYVIAHEVAHHVQHVTGTLGQVNQQRARVSERESNALSVRIELQADCYSGIWARQAQARLRITDADIRQALETAAAIGDDALQRAAGRATVPDSFTHGTSAQRQRWFDAGFRSGNPGACDTFSARSL